MPLTAPQDAAVVMAANRPVAAMPKRASLPSMLPPGCGRAGHLIDAQRGQQRIALLLLRA